MIKNNFCIFWMTLIFLNPLLAADLDREKIVIPLINKESTNQEIANFYKSLGDNCSFRVFYYFAFDNQNFYDNVDREHEKQLEKIEKNTKLSEVEKIKKGIELSRLGNEILKKTFHYKFADECELEEEDDKTLKIGKLTKPNKVTGKESSLRMLFNILMTIKYQPLPNNYTDILCEELKSLDHKGTCSLMEKFMDLYSKLDNLTLNFTRKNAHFLYNIAVSGGKIINNKNYLDFIGDGVEFYKQYFEMLLSIVNLSSQFDPEISKKLKENMEKKGINGPELSVNLKYRIKKRDCEFNVIEEESEDERLKKIVLEKWGFEYHLK